MGLRQLGTFFAIVLLCAYPAKTWAISISQTDDFENGTTMNWTDGNGGTNVANITTGGPAGANPNYSRRPRATGLRVV